MPLALALALALAPTPTLSPNPNPNPTPNQVRLKIRLLAEDTPAMLCPWDEAHNAASLEAYALRRDVVSAGCRLTPREELELLRLYLPRSPEPEPQPQPQP